MLLLQDFLEKYGYLHHEHQLHNAAEVQSAIRWATGETRRVRISGAPCFGVAACIQYFSSGWGRIISVWDRPLGHKTTPMSALEESPEPSLNHSGILQTSSPYWSRKRCPYWQLRWCCLAICTHLFRFVRRPPAYSWCPLIAFRTLRHGFLSLQRVPVALPSPHHRAAGQRHPEADGRASLRGVGRGQPAGLGTEGKGHLYREETTAAPQEALCTPR